MDGTTNRPSVKNFNSIEMMKHDLLSATKVVFTMFKIDDYKHDKVNPAQLKKMNLTAQKTHMEINDKKTIALFELDVTRVPPRLK